MIDFLRNRAVLIFDLDNTLCNHDESVELARREAYYHAERLAALSGNGDPSAREARRERVRETLAGPADPILLDKTGAAGRADTWAGLLGRVGIDHRMAAMRAAATYERRRMEELKPLPEVRRFLEIVRRSHRLVILADGPAAHQRRALSRMRLDEAVHDTVFEEDLGGSRPDADLFRRLLDRLGSSPDDAAFAGDHPPIDFPGAIAVGIGTIWRRPHRAARRAPRDPAPDVEVDGFLELIPRIDRRMGDR